jgi:hypothetical protein
VRFRLLPSVILILTLAVVGQAVADPEFGPGSLIESLTVGSVTYQDVQVRSVNARTLFFTYRGGMASVHLRDLSPVWQARFHYNQVAEAAADEALDKAPPPVSRPRVAHVTPLPAGSTFDRLLQSFGQPAEIRPEVDLRPKYFQLELGVKNQGHRPSCAVFAIVGALELQNAELAGKVEKFSEEYLIWATRQTVHRLPPPDAVAPDGAAADEQDEGFALTEVVEALRAYGIPLQASMPNTFGSKMQSIEDPPPAIVQEARSHQRVFVHQLPGRDEATRLNSIVQALDAGVPVPAGMSWPASRVVNGFISTQQGAPNRGHAVTLVGYKSANGRIEDSYFIFKNSWGPRWGQGGYGTVTYDYLRRNLFDAVVLEVLPESTR